MKPSLAIRSVLWLWLIAALVAGRQLWLQRLPMPAVPGLLFGLTALILLAYWGIPFVRAWADALDLRLLVLLHAVRFVGFWFLFLWSRGELPYAFAVPGGIGDIIVALLALVAALAPWGDRARRRVINVWNVVGLTDILLVVFTAARLGLADPSSMRALTRLPLSLLPTFVVPLILATHVIILARLRREMR
jgi:hypothetical protein